MASLYRRFPDWIARFWFWLISAAFALISRCFVNKHRHNIPEHVVVDILSKLPIKDISRYRLVCKKWLEVTSTHDFIHSLVQINDNRADNKVLFLQCSSKVKKDPFFNGFFILNKEAKGKKNIVRKVFPDLNVPTNFFPFAYMSCNGLVVFKPHYSYDQSKCHILNPTTQECVIIRCKKGVLCGLYYHQLSKEYRALYTHFQDNVRKYFLYSLEIESSLRELGSFPFYPSGANPVFINGVFHWMVSDGTCENRIMTFDVETEGFDSFPHPGGRCLNVCKHKYMSLLELTGQLCFSHTHIDYIDMWVLEDKVNRIWIKTCVVSLEWDLSFCPSTNNVANDYLDQVVVLLNIDENKELLLYWVTKGLFIYNLDNHKVRKINLSGIKVAGKLAAVEWVIAYKKSLVSLKAPNKYPNYSGKFPTTGLVTIDI